MHYWLIQLYCQPFSGKTMVFRFYLFFPKLFTSNVLSIKDLNPHNWMLRNCLCVCVCMNVCVSEPATYICIVMVTVYGSSCNITYPTIYNIHVIKTERLTERQCWKWKTNIQTNEPIEWTTQNSRIIKSLLYLRINWWPYMRNITIQHENGHVNTKTVKLYSVSHKNVIHYSICIIDRCIRNVFLFSHSVFRLEPLVYNSP